MRYTCPPQPYDHVALHLTKRRSGFALDVSHTHAGGVPGQCDPDRYRDLTWPEVSDLLEAILEEMYPGAHPHGQLDLFSRPQGA